MRRAQWVILAVLLAAPLGFAVEYVREFLAVDQALDLGASYDYRTGRAADDEQNHPYIRFSERHATWLAVAVCSMLGAAGYGVLLISRAVVRPSACGAQDRQPCATKGRGITAFVHGGGWIRYTVWGRPVTRWLVIASFVSGCLSAVGASLLIPMDSPTIWQDLLTLRAALILSPSPLLALASVVFYFIERPRDIELERPAGCDPHNLY